MENKSKQKGKKFAAFLKRNVYYLVIIVCLAAIGTILGVTLTKDKQNETPVSLVDPVGETPVNTDPAGNEPIADDPVIAEPDPIIFALPVSGATVSKDYVMDSVVWNTTLRQYEAHGGIDFAAAEGTDVKAVFGGKIVKITYDILRGNVVTIKHSDQLTTVYCSLKDVKVAVGDVVEKGAVIGTVGATMGREGADGAHLHFETYLNGELVDGNAYFAGENK